MGTSSKLTGLGAALFGKGRRGILALLFGHSDEEFYLRQIVRATGLGVGPVQRELKRLSDAGILTRTRRGRQVFFRANKACPVFADLKNLITKTAGLADVVAAALEPLADRIEAAFIYGSFAQGRERAESDVDLFIIGGATFGEVVAALSPAQETLAREINPSVMGAEEFRDKVKSDSAFVRRVLEGEKIFLIGKGDDLTAVAR